MALLDGEFAIYHIKQQILWNKKKKHKQSKSEEKIQEKKMYSFLCCTFFTLTKNIPSLNKKGKKLKIIALKNVLDPSLIRDSN